MGDSETCGLKWLPKWLRHISNLGKSKKIRRFRWLAAELASFFQPKWLISNLENPSDLQNRLVISRLFFFKKFNHATFNPPIPLIIPNPTRPENFDSISNPEPNPPTKKKSSDFVISNPEPYPPTKKSPISLLINKSRTHPTKEKN